MILHRHHLSTLRSLRRQHWIKWLQITTVFLWSLFPPFYTPAPAAYTPDSQSPPQPVWDGNGDEPESGPDLSDDDSDGLPNWFEQWLGSDVGNPDTDYDGLSDADEQYLTGTDPINWDSDNDGYSDHDAYYSCWAVNHNAVGFGQSVYDWDGDGIYNPQDAWPLDANNGSYDPSTYDSDGDGYADANDSHPYDYSVWGDWGTGDEPSGEPDSGEGDPEPADDDSDDDGFPDGQDSDPMDSSLWDDANRNGINDSAEVDPYSNDADNDTIVDAHDSHPWDSSLWSDWNSNNQNDEDETGNSGGDPPAEDPVDSDGDGIVDAYDSHPSDSALYSDWNFNSQNDHEENSGGGDPPEDHADSDGDTVLDPNDSHPNNSSLWNDFNGNNINDDDNDPLVLNSDEDEVVDALDSHPFDSALWNDFNHNGINDHDGDPMFQDSDSDGVPDATDSHPDNLDLWNDHNDNGVNDEEPDEDQDGDGVINFEDSHPKNPSIWSDWDFDALNHEAEITHQTDPNHPDSDRDGLTDGEEVSHGTSPLYTDSDGDGLPDFPELRGHYGSSASDAFSLSKKKGWGSLYHDGQIVDTTDSDRDGIPNSIEELYGLSPSNPADALSDLDGDGITNLAAFRQGKSLCGVVSPLDRDGDGLTDAQEDYWGRNGGVYLSKFNPNDAVEDPDNDDLMNWQEIALGSHPGSLTSMGAAFDLNCGDGTVAFWQALILPSSPDHARALARLPAQYHALIPTWADQTMQTSYDSETDQTWVSGPALGLQAFLSDVPPADRGPGRNAPGDYDGDSMPDRWEWRYRQKLNLLDPADAGTPNQAPTLKQDPDSDALSNLAEFQLNTHPLLPDTDGDGFSDGLEIQHGTNPTQSTSLPPITLSLVSGNSQTTLVDTIAAQPLTIATRRITTPVPGTPVTFTVTSLNGGKLSTNPAGPWQPAVTVLSSISGVAQVYWNAPLSPSSASVVASSAATSASSLTFDLTATPTNPNNPNNPNNPTDPANPANPSTFHVFTAHRTKTASFSGSEGSYCKQEIVEDPIIEDGLYSISEIRPTHDGFDGDADIAENPVDDGDPRDLNLLHLYIQNPILTHFVPPDTPGAVAVQPFPSTLYTPTDVYSRVTSPPKGYYQADDAFIATSPVTGENNSSTYNPETLTTMLSTVPWAPSVQDGWMGNGRRGISTYSASASWTHYSWSAPCGNPIPEPPEDPTTNPEGDDCCGSSGSSGGGTVTTVGMSGTTAAANHTQVRLQSSHTVNDPAGLSRTFLLLQKRTNFTPQGDISDEPIITSLGTATLTIPQGQKISTQVSGTASLTHLRIEGGIAYIELAPPPSIPNTRIELDLLPVDLAIDANRDGTIASGETASQEKPFRFWINEDWDTWGGDDNPEKIDLAQKDFTSGVITCKRDLEDFTMLQCGIESIADKIRSGEFQLGLKWTNVSDDAPTLYVYRCPPEIHKSADYLSGDEKASLLDGKFNIGFVGGSSVAWLPSDAFGTEATPHPYLLFEGGHKGKGKLTLVLKANGQTTEGPGAWIKLMHSREMIQRGKATYAGGAAPGDVPDPWDQPSPVTMQAVPDNTPSFDPDPDETSECVVHVHGWRMSEEESVNWSEMSFKRLWHLGYKGRFASFRWPTYSGPLGGYHTYNPSEYRAWLSGDALAAFVNGINKPAGEKRLFAHSMGNVITGAALTKGMQIGTYAMLNSAMASMAYQGDYVDFHDYSTPDTDLDPATQSLGLKNQFNLPGNPTIINFYLPDDSALTGWIANNEINKPSGGLFNSYDYNWWAQPGMKLVCNGILSTRVVNKLPEALAFVTRSRSGTAGMTSAVQGTVQERVGMYQFGFGSEHSAQWNFRFQKTFDFWTSLADRLGISTIVDEP